MAIPYYSFSTNASATRYTQYYGSGTLYTTEAEARCVMPKGIVKGLWVNVITNGMSSVVFTLMKNGVASSLAVSYGASETGLKSATTDVAFEEGDEYSIRVVWVHPGGAPQNLAYTGGGLSYGNY
jgi:NAD(P)-dependent dehydrogenase (short-subunit alcohol dehydrogenase family)